MCNEDSLSGSKKCATERLRRLSANTVLLTAVNFVLLHEKTAHGVGVLLLCFKFEKPLTDAAGLSCWIPPGTSCANNFLHKVGWSFLGAERFVCRQCLLDELTSESRTGCRGS